MQSLLLTSILVMSIVIPIVAARDALPRRGLRRAVVAMLVFEALYLAACMYVYPRLA